MTDLQAKVRYSDVATAEKKEMQDTIRKALEQLMAVREDMARTRELGKALDQLEEDKSSMSSWRSSDNSSRQKTSMDVDSIEQDSMTSGERLAPIGKEAEPDKTGTGATRKTLREAKTISESSFSSTTSMTRSAVNTAYYPSKSRTENWEARIAEIRLRSPSPSPRKVTNYPEAPPSMVLSKLHHLSILLIRLTDANWNACRR